MSDQEKDVSKNLNIYKLDKTEDVMNYYADWAENNKYNKDMINWNYTGPKETAAAFKKHQQNKDALILDAGCGTGLVAHVQLALYHNPHRVLMHLYFADVF